MSLKRLEPLHNRQKTPPKRLFINTGAGRENRTLISSLENLHTNHCTIPAYANVICKPKSFRLVFSPREVLLLIERARKNAKMEDFSRKFGVGYRDRTDDLLDHNPVLYHPRFWGERWDSNPRPPGPQSGALTKLSYSHHV